jgi:hypothetical protein
MVGLAALDPRPERSCDRRCHGSHHRMTPATKIRTIRIPARRASEGEPARTFAGASGRYVTSFLAGVIISAPRSSPPSASIAQPVTGHHRRGSSNGRSRRSDPNSALSLWCQRRVGSGNALARKVGIAALTRKQLVALWKNLEGGKSRRGRDPAERSSSEGSSGSAAVAASRRAAGSDWRGRKGDFAISL